MGNSFRRIGLPFSKRSALSSKRHLSTQISPGGENLDIIRRILGLPKADVEDALELVGLTEFGDRLAKQYSLGMKQRLGLAGALLGRPPILILDEPTNGLDPSGIHEIRNLVKSLPSLYDCTVLISSHMLSEIELIADDIGILNHGRLLFEGSMNDLRQYAPAIRLRCGQSGRCVPFYG